jgi:hypothetical protein
MIRTLRTRLYRVEACVPGSQVCVTCQWWGGSKVCAGSRCHPPDVCPDCGREIPARHITRLASGSPFLWES